MLSSPKYQRKRKIKQELKFVEFLHISIPPALAFVSPFSTHKDTHTQSIYTTIQASEKKGPFHLKYNR